MVYMRKRFMRTLPLPFVIGIMVLLGTGCGSLSFVERCRDYSEAHDTLPYRMSFESFPSEELMKLLGSGKVDDWKKALADDDPKVRTLGILAIGLGDDPSLIPLLRSSLDDDAASFDQEPPSYISDRKTIMKREGYPYAPERAVAYYARVGIGEWTNGGYMATSLDFDEYWNKVKDPEALVSVWRCRLIRAELAARPALVKACREARERLAKGRSNALLTPAEHRQIRDEGVKAMMKQAMPARHRLEKEQPPRVQMLVALSLRYPLEYDRYWSDAEKKELVRQNLSREDAIAFLRREMPFGDPSLSSNKIEYSNLCAAILDYVAWKPEDSDLLLKLWAEEQKRKDGRVLIPNWVLAASRAQESREKSLRILKDALDQPKGEYEHWIWSACMREIWDVGGLDEADYLVDQFYGKNWTIDFLWPQQYLVKDIASPGDDGKVFLGKLIRDKRFEDTCPMQVHDIAERCNALAGETIIPWQELIFPQLPFSSQNLRTKEGMEQAKAKYPGETEEILKKTADWRKHLTDYVEQHDW